MSEVTATPLVAAIVASYLLGSIPAAYIAGRLKGIDLRKHGSGNLGATNVFRVLGAKIGLVVFAFDMAKGAVPVLLALRLLRRRRCRGRSATIAGDHVRRRGDRRARAPDLSAVRKGGKGVATAAGVFVALAPLQTLLDARRLRASCCSRAASCRSDR